MIQHPEHPPIDNKRTLNRTKSDQTEPHRTQSEQVSRQTVALSAFEISAFPPSPLHLTNLVKGILELLPGQRCGAHCLVRWTNCSKGTLSSSRDTAAQQH